MKTILRTALTIMVVAAASPAQNTDFSFAHGIPGLPNAVDVAVDGTTVFSAVDFGDLKSTTIAPGLHTVEVLDGNSVLLSTTVTTGMDESFTAAAHLLTGGAPNLAVLENDVSPVTFAGDGRFTVRHLADAGPVFFGLESGTELTLSGLANGTELVTEVGAGVFTLDVVQIGPTLPFPFPPSARIAQGLNLAADTGIIAHIVGVPGTASFSVIVQNVTLPPAGPINPGACDLTLSGSLVGGSLSAGGDVVYDLTGATPNSICVVFLAFDNNPVTVFNIPLGIGSNGLDVVAFGLADANGNFSQTVNYPPSTGSGSPSTFTFFTQAASGNATAGGFLPTCVSDVELLQITIP